MSSKTELRPLLTSSIHWPSESDQLKDSFDLALLSRQNPNSRLPKSQDLRIVCTCQRLFEGLIFAIGFAIRKAPVPLGTIPADPAISPLEKKIATRHTQPQKATRRSSACLRLLDPIVGA